MSFRDFDLLYIEVIVHVDTVKDKLKNALEATEYSAIANFSPDETFEPALRAYESLEECFHSNAQKNQTNASDYSRYMTVTSQIDELGKQIKEEYTPALNDLKKKLFIVNPTAAISENNYLLLTGDDSQINDTRLHPALGAGRHLETEDTSFLSYLTIPNILLLLLVGVVLRQLGVCRPLDYGAKKIYHSLFGMKKEKTDIPEDESELLDTIGKHQILYG